MRRVRFEEDDADVRASGTMRVARLRIRGKSTPKNLRRSRLKCGECFFGHQNGGRIYLNGVSRSGEIRRRPLDALQGETFGRAEKEPRWRD